MDTNCLLVRAPQQTLLIDTGYGTKGTEAEREMFDFAGPSLVEKLAGLGVSPDQVDAVVLTHLHFDHAGGCTRRTDTGELVPVFPRARHFVQRAEWDDATGRIPELKGSYFPHDFQPLADAGQLELVEGAAELVPGVSVRPVKGHTRGHQVVDIASGGLQAVYLGDVCPMTPHLRPFWTMAYDQFPLETRRNKPVVLDEIVQNHWLAIFDHDPRTRAAHLAYDAKSNLVLEETVELS
jgi:glyoxylase-like metal-dependent hydrolase (beta-lactamase superfamily II)